MNRVMTCYRFAVFLMGLGVAMLLSGCSESDVMEVRAAALSEDDTYQGYLRLKEFSEGRPVGCLLATKACKESRKQVAETIVETSGELLLNAVERGQERLIHVFFGPNWIYDKGVIPSASSKVEAMKALLERVKDPQTSPRMLYLVAQHVARGLYTEQNFDLAIALAERSWAGGNSRAASLLTDIYRDAKDGENAYFWSIRCIGSCRSVALDREAKEHLKGLDREVIKKVQTLALDPSRMRVIR